MLLLTERFVSWGVMDQSFLKEWPKINFMAPMSTLNLPTFFVVFTSTFFGTQLVNLNIV